MNDSVYPSCSAKALQSVIPIIHPEQWFKSATPAKMEDVEIKDAQEILKKWKDKFVELVNSEGARLRGSKIMTLTREKYQERVDEMSIFKKKASIWGCVLTVRGLFL